ncbi:MAG: hypothetical protein RBS81_05015 [Tenuifilaceae bacterium]|jgi:hypothetical protein|nr:hypothetical protein [Tenuifilaceae bacterium]
MKKLNFRILLSLFVISTLFVGCSDDEDAPKNHITYDGVTKTISAGLLENYGSAGLSSYNFDITLYEGLKYSQTTGFSGTGNLIYFELFSSSATELVPGTYTYDALETTNANTFDAGFIAIGIEIASETADEIIYIASGKVTVKKDGSTYTIDIDCTSTDGKKITGYYKGSLSYEDYTTYGRKKSSLVK